MTLTLGRAHVEEHLGTRLPGNLEKESKPRNIDVSDGLLTALVGCRKLIVLEADLESKASVKTVVPLSSSNKGRGPTEGRKQKVNKKPQRQGGEGPSLERHFVFQKASRAGQPNLSTKRSNKIEAANHTSWVNKKKKEGCEGGGDKQSRIVWREKRQGQIRLVADRTTTDKNNLSRQKRPRWVERDGLPSEGPPDVTLSIFPGSWGKARSGGRGIKPPRGQGSRPWPPERKRLSVKILEEACNARRKNTAHSS